MLKNQGSGRYLNFSSQQTEDKIVFICGSKIDHFTRIGYHSSKASTKSFNTNKTFFIMKNRNFVVIMSMSSAKHFENNMTNDPAYTT